MDLMTISLVKDVRTFANAEANLDDEGAEGEQEEEEIQRQDKILHLGHTTTGNCWRLPFRSTDTMLGYYTNTVGSFDFDFVLGKREQIDQVSIGNCWPVF